MNTETNLLNHELDNMCLNLNIDPTLRKRVEEGLKEIDLSRVSDFKV